MRSSCNGLNCLKCQHDLLVRAAHVEAFILVVALASLDFTNLMRCMIGLTAGVVSSTLGGIATRTISLPNALSSGKPSE